CGPSAYSSPFFRADTPQRRSLPLPSLFLFNPPSTTHIYTLSLHDALPILLHAPADRARWDFKAALLRPAGVWRYREMIAVAGERSEEHTSELQSLRHLVCRLLLEKKKKREWDLACRCRRCIRSTLRSGFSM